MATSVAPAPPLILQFLNNAGLPNVGGSLLTQVGGVNYPTFQDSAGNTPLPNPIPLNSRGEISNTSGVSSQLFMSDSVVYQCTLKDAFGNVVWVAENVVAEGASATGVMTDEKGSNGLPGFSAANGDFVPGTTESLTLSGFYGSASNLWVAFDAAEQGANTFTLNGYTLTFGSYVGTVFTPAPIPVGTNFVFVKGGTTATTATVSPGSITDADIASGTALANRLNYLLSVKDPQFGAAGNGTTDDTAAIQAAINAVGLNGGTLYFPPGTYKTTATLNVAKGLVRLYGAGKAISTIACNQATGDTLAIGSPTSALQSVYIDGLSFSPSVAKASGNEIHVIGNNINIFVDDVIFTGGFTHYFADSYGAASSYWLTNYYSQGSAGPAVAVGGNNGFMQDVWIADAIMGNNETHFDIVWASGFYIRNIDAELASGTALQINPTAGHEVVAGWFESVLFDTNASVAIDLSTKGGNTASLRFKDCWCSGGNASGLIILDDVTSGGALNDIRFSGGVVQGGTQHGAFVVGGKHIRFDGVEFSNNGSSNPGTSSGCFVNANVSDFTFVNCSSGFLGVTAVTGGTAVQGYGLTVAGGAVNNLIVANNNFDGNITAPFQNLSTGINQKVVNNVPNPTFSTPAVPASTASITNPAGRDIRVFISGGTFTAVVLNGATIGIAGNNCDFIWRAGETLSITYSAAPTWAMLDF
jgi:Pectate lyase superfamily protein